METIEIQKPADMHIHLRDVDDPRFEIALREALGYATILPMPNLREPLLTTEGTMSYYWRIKNSLPVGKLQKIIPCMYFHVGLTLKELTYAHACGINVIKGYPQDGTTNSQYGMDFENIQQYYPTFEIMERKGMIFSVHGEVSMYPRLAREINFMHKVFPKLHHKFPKLKIVIEHVSDYRTIDMIEQLPDNIAATITPHHLILTIDDVMGNPHHDCHPVAKYEMDKYAIRKVATSGNPKFFFGSDSAPHLKYKKEFISKKFAGIFTPYEVAVPVVAQVFEESGVLAIMDNFMSVFGPRFYGLPPSEDEIKLIKKPWEVPLAYSRKVAGEATDFIVPLLAGQTLDWQVEGT